jgi:diacylglycerol O-acyltransferase
LRENALVEGIVLTAEDCAILDLECAAIVGHTCKVIVFETGAPSAAALGQRMRERIAAAPALARRLGGSPDRRVWIEEPGFDPAQHVCEQAAGDPCDRAGLRREVARLFVERLDRDRPLWRIDRIALQDEGAALVWRIHHALADGSTAMRYARALLWDAPADMPAAPEPEANQPAARESRAHDRAARDSAGRSRTSAHERSAHERDQARRRAHLAHFFAREFARSGGDSPFDGRIGGHRDVAFAALPLRELHDAAAAIDGATVNDAVLTVVGGGLRRWIEQHHGRIDSLRVKVPVSLHEPAGDGTSRRRARAGPSQDADPTGSEHPAGPGGEDPGNRDSFFSVPVPLTHGDTVARLRAVHAATTVRKAEHDAETMDALLHRLRQLSPGLGRLCERIERSPRAFAVNVSNVPGPREPVSVLGTRVGSLHAIAELAEHHALRIAAVSLAGTLCLGFCADPAIVDDVQSMAAATEDEAAELIAAA